MNDKVRENIIESILFITGDPVNIKVLIEAIELDNKEGKKFIKKYVEYYNNQDTGLKIIQIRDSYQLTTRPENFKYISKVYEKVERVKITPALIETLSIIAYKQPITKNDIQSIRGVKSDNIINRLIEYNLVEEKGRLDQIGRPIIFGTTDKFLRYFGFSTLEDLPDIKEVEKSNLC